MRMSSWETQNSSNLIYFFTDSKPIHSVAFGHGSENYLLSGHAEGGVCNWNLKTHRREENVNIKAGPTQCMAIRFCGDALLTQDKSGLVTCWRQDKENWKIVREISLDYFGFCKLDTRDNTIICPWNGAIVKVYNDNLDEIASLKPISDKLGTVTVCKLVTIDTNMYALAGYESSELVLWNVRTCDNVGNLLLNHGVPLAVDFDEDECKGVVGFTSKRLVLFKIDVFLNFSKIDSVKLNNNGVNCVKIHKPLGVFAVGCWDAKVSIFSWSSYSLLYHLTFHAGSIEDICFSNEIYEDMDEGYLLAVGSVDCKISLWVIPDLTDDSSDS